MKRNYYDIIESKAYKAHLKAEALRYFFSNYMDGGSARRDEEAIAGIGYILEDISNEARMAHKMLSDVKRPPLDTMAEDFDHYGDQYPEPRVDILEKIKKGLKEV